MTLKSNIIFEPDTSVDVFLDSVQEVESNHRRELMQWDASQIAETKIRPRYRRPSSTQYAGKLTSDIIANKRKLVYLNGYPDNVIVVDGGNRNAIYGSVDQLRMSNQDTNACLVEFMASAKGGITGQYIDVADCTSTGSQASDSDAADGYAELLNANVETIYYNITQTDYELPEGDYTMFVRLKDSNQVTNDVVMQILNTTDSTSLVSAATITATAAYAYTTLDFTVASDDVGDTIQFRINKGTATTNNIYIDFMGFVKI